MAMEETQCSLDQSELHKWDPSLWEFDLHENTETLDEEIKAVPHEWSILHR